MNRLPLLTFTFALAALVGGCAHRNHSSTSVSSASVQQVKAAQREQQASDLVLLEQIPPPAKSRYMAIRTKSSWDNPFLVVSTKTVSLRVMNPEPPTSGLLPGHLMQPVSARKNLLELRLADLPEALASIPENDWPYGRVIAVEEDPSEVRADRVQVRRNVEAAMKVLNDLGVVVYEWPAGR